MSSISHGPTSREPLAVRLRIPEMWASIAISVMWLAVLCDAIWGPDFVSTSSGGNMTKIPSAIVLAVFAYLGTAVLARYGFGDGRKHKKD